MVCASWRLDGIPGRSSRRATVRWPGLAFVTVAGDLSGAPASFLEAGIVFQLREKRSWQFCVENVARARHRKLCAYSLICRVLLLRAYQQGLSPKCGKNAWTQISTSG